MYSVTRLDFRDNRIVDPEGVTIDPEVVTPKTIKVQSVSTDKRF